MYYFVRSFSIFIHKIIYYCLNIIQCTLIINPLEIAN